MSDRQDPPAPRGLAAAIVMAVIASALFWQQFIVNHDTAWFTYVMAGLMDGADYRASFDDPNWPLAATLMLPAAALWRLGVDISTAVNLEVHAVALGCLLACLAVYRRCRFAAGSQWAMLAALAAALLALPGNAFGEREQFFALLFLPYLALAGARLDGVMLGRPLAVAIGLAAGVAATIKPPFILAPACVEVVLLIRRPGWKTPLRPETVAGLATALVMAAVGLAIHPHYLDTVPRLVRYYDAYGSLGLMATVSGILATLAVAAFAAAWLGAKARRNHVAVLMAAVLAMLAVYAVQLRGLPYQALPVMSLTAALVGVALPPTGRGRAALAGAAAAGLVWMAAVLLWPAQRPAELAALIARYQAAPPGPVSALLLNPEPLSAATTVRRAWGNRFNCLFLLPGLVREERAAAAAGRAPDPQEQGVAEGLRTAAAEDLERFRPTLVAIRPDTQGPPPFDFDILAWLSRSPRFALAWAAYQEDGSAGPYRLYRLRTADRVQ